ncbi:hypothetical protein HNY73_005900 [Argiope bruennichi]|uniref:Uncharacterized protein n=1 Tax=Argiope bruennichi TaxID=94029 RepID=A0A8T0FIX9_ARGBR|nr:hypothetical protein HNY73_005900 [Argiope bruennichi]
MLARGIVLLHHNASTRNAAANQELLDQFGWEIFDHKSIDFPLFSELKEFLDDKRFGRDKSSSSETGDQFLGSKNEKCAGSFSIQSAIIERKGVRYLVFTYQLNIVLLYSLEWKFTRRIGEKIK